MFRSLRLLTLVGLSTVMGCGGETTGTPDSGRSSDASTMDGSADPACVDDSGCPTGQTCENGSCEVRTCRTERDCPSSQPCVAGICIPVPCDSASECAPGETCSEGSCAALPCDVESPCPTGATCVAGRCAPTDDECVDGDCPTGARCSDEGACAAVACSNASDCPTGAACVTGSCAFRACTTPSDCPVEHACTDGACVAGTEVTDGFDRRRTSPYDEDENGRIIGAVTDLSGTPLSGVRVSLDLADRSTDTDADGRYELPDVPAGRRVVHFEGDGYLDYNRAVDVAAWETVFADAELMPRSAPESVDPMTESTAGGEDGVVTIPAEALVDPDTGLPVVDDVDVSVTVIDPARLGLIRVVPGSELVDGETFTIDDGINPPVTFEFDSDGMVSPGNVPVPFSADDDVNAVLAAILAAIDNPLPSAAGEVPSTGLEASPLAVNASELTPGVIVLRSPSPALVEGPSLSETVTAPGFGVELDPQLGGAPGDFVVSDPDGTMRCSGSRAICTSADACPAGETCESGGETVLDSWVMVDLVTVDADGNPVELEDGETIEVVVPAPNNPDGSTPMPGDMVPTWVYDPDVPGWVPDGFATVEIRDGQLVLVGNVNSANIQWNCDDPVVPVCYTGRVLDCSGYPIRGAEMRLRGSGVTSGATVQTDMNGRYTVSGTARGGAIVRAQISVGDARYREDSGVEPIADDGCEPVDDLVFSELRYTGGRVDFGRQTVITALGGGGDTVIGSVAGSALFYDPADPSTSAFASCAQLERDTLRFVDGGVMGGGDDIRTLDVGNPVVVAGSGGAVDLLRTFEDTDGSSSLLRYTSPADAPEAFAGDGAESLSIDIPGGRGAMPRASISGGLQLPARLTFIAPAPDSARVVSAGGALNLEWTAGTGDTLVALTVTRPDQPGRALLAELTDDGSFTVPASELDRFRGGRAFITLTRFEERYPRLPTGPSLVTRMFSGATIDVQLD